MQSAAPSYPCTLCLRRLAFVGISASRAAALLTACQHDLHTGRPCCVQWLLGLLGSHHVTVFELSTPTLQEYSGGYWESRAKGQWEGCRDIFGE